MYESNYIILTGYSEYLIEIIFTALIFTVAIKFLRNL